MPAIHGVAWHTSLPWLHQDCARLIVLGKQFAFVIAPLQTEFLVHSH